LSEYQNFAFLYITPALAVPLVTAIIYYGFDRRDAKRRVLVSAHPTPLVVAGVYAIVVSPWPQNRQILIWPFMLMLVLFVFWLIYTFIRFEGNKAVHLMQLFQLPFAAYLLFFGTMAITHDGL
jgi:succinate dehydrogenase hydrophobic anchor subunit